MEKVVKYPVLITKEAGIVWEWKLYGDGDNPESYKLFIKVLKKGGQTGKTYMKTGIKAIVCYVTENMSPEKYWEEPTQYWMGMLTIKAQIEWENESKQFSLF